MRARRFVGAGYPLRTLNQAYFAVHVSYGTGPAASTSATAAGPALAPLLEELRAAAPSLADFLRPVRTLPPRAALEAATAPR